MGKFFEAKSVLPSFYLILDKMSTFTFTLFTKIFDFQQFNPNLSTMRVSLQNMTDEELLKNQWDSGAEMLRRNMVGAEIWQTPNEIVTSGCPEARVAILNIYGNPQSGFEKVLDDCALKAAQNGAPENGQNIGAFQISQQSIKSYI